MPNENVYTEAHGFKFPNGTTIPIEDAEAREDISEVKQSLSQLLQYTDVTGTTTASGALAIPADLYDVPIIDPHYVDSNVGLVFRRDRGYLTCCDNNRYTLANVSVTVRIYYINN